MLNFSQRILSHQYATLLILKHQYISFSSRPATFIDRDEAKLILDLEVVLESSPKFDLPLFQDCLVQKDNYGVGSVKRIHVMQAAENSKLVGLEGKNGILKRWLAACDARPPQMLSDEDSRQSHVGGGGSGMYRIDKLVSYLERSRPHVVDRIRKKVSNAAAGGGKEGTGWSSAKLGHHKVSCKLCEMLLADKITFNELYLLFIP